MFDKLLVAVDGSQSALKAAVLAGEIARKFGSQVTLLHVQHLPATVLAASGMAGMVGPERATTAALEETVREALRAARESLGLPEGRSTKEIAALLHVSVKTLKTHRSHLMQKLRAKSVADLTRVAIAEGIISVDV